MSNNPFAHLFQKPPAASLGFGLNSPQMQPLTQQITESFKEMLAERPPPGFFRLSRRADADAVIEAAGGFRFETEGTYWGDLMLAAKKAREIVIPDVDCCTAWCVVKTDMKVKPMTPIIKSAKRRKIIASAERWAIIVPEEWGLKYVKPYLEMDLNGEMGGVSFLEYLVTFGGIAPEIARACASRYAKVRKGDALRLDARDVTGLLGAAAGREAALAADSESP